MSISGYHEDQYAAHLQPATLSGRGDHKLLAELGWAVAGPSLDGFDKGNWQPGRETQHGLLLDKMTLNQPNFVKSSRCQKRLKYRKMLIFNWIHFDTALVKPSVGYLPACSKTRV